MKKNKLLIKYLILVLYVIVLPITASCHFVDYVLTGITNSELSIAASLLGLVYFVALMLYIFIKIKLKPLIKIEWGAILGLSIGVGSGKLILVLPACFVVITPQKR